MKITFTFDTSKFEKADDDMCYAFVISWLGGIIGIGLIAWNVSDIIFYPFIGIMLISLSVLMVKIAYKTKMGKLLCKNE